jgi:hypothetical protein
VVPLLVSSPNSTSWWRRLAGQLCWWLMVWVRWGWVQCTRGCVNGGAVLQEV